MRKKLLKRSVAFLLLLATNSSAFYAVVGGGGNPVAPPASESPRTNICLNGWWDISINTSTQPDPEYDAVLVWPPSSVEDDWHPTVMPQNVYKSQTEFLFHSEDVLWQSTWGPGNAWFRRDFMIPSKWEGKRVLFRSGGICYDSAIYINGALAGRHRNPMPFVLDISDFVEYGQENTIHIGYQSSDVVKRIGGEPVEPVSKFTPRLKGIVGDLFVEAVGGTYIDFLDIIADVQLEELTLSVGLNNPQLADDIDIGANIYDGETLVKTIAPENIVLNGAATGSAQLSMDWPGVRLWQPDDPHLYNLELTVSSSGTVLDQWRQRFGFRDFEAQQGRFYLNGNPITLVGTSHYYNPDSSLFSPDYVRSYYRALKALNFNTCRLHCIPYPAVWHQIADEEGMLIVSEGLFSAGTGVDYNPTERWSRFEDYFREWVLRERNHPSVVMWSVYNEGKKDLPLDDIYAIVQQWDGSGRPVYSEGHCEPWNDFDTEVISLHYPFSFNEFPFWPADLYFLDPAEASLYGCSSLFERLQQYGFYAPAIADNPSAFINPYYKAQLLSDFAALPYSNRWTVATEDARPLSFGEAMVTWFLSMKEFSRFAGPDAFTGVYDAEDGGFWHSLGSLVGDTVDAYRYMGLNHLSTPWQPDNFAFVKLFNPDGTQIVKEQWPRDLLEPGYHPTHLKSYYSRVNPGWNPAVPEYIVTATGQEMEKANQPIRLSIKPGSLGFYTNQTLVRDYSLNNNSPLPEVLDMAVMMDGTNVESRMISVGAGETIRTNITVSLAGFPEGIHQFGIMLTNDVGEVIQTSTESIRIAAPSTADVGNLEILVFDPAGETQTVLAQLGVSYATIASLTELYSSNAATVVIGENTVQQSDSYGTVLDAWLGKGGEILLLAQRYFGGIDGLFSGSTTSMDLPNARTFICAPDHDMANGLLPLDFFLWGTNRMVTGFSLAPFDPANASYVAVQGGKSGLSYPVVAEFIKDGSQRIVWLQCLCVSKFTETPSAMMVLKNALEHMNTPLVPLKGLANATSTPGLQSLVSQFGLQTGDPQGTVSLLGANDSLTAGDISSLGADEILWINNPSASQLAVLAAELDAISLKATDVNHPQLELASGANNLVAAGITNWELFPANIATTLSSQVVDLQSSGANWVPLVVEPSHTRFGATFGTGPETDLLSFSVAFPFREIVDPGAAMAMAETASGGMVVLDTIQWSGDWIATDQAKLFLVKFMTNLGLETSL